MTIEGRKTCYSLRGDTAKINIMTVQELIDLLNNNQGVLSLILFVVTILVGWATGIFRSLIKKPSLKLG